MGGYEVRFNVYAESQAEADAASAAIKAFINAKARTGVAVTAAKLTQAVEKWKDNYFVNQYFK